MSAAEIAQNSACVPNSLAVRESVLIRRTAETGHWRELGRNLWLALGCFLVFAWVRERPSYCGYLFGMLVEPVRLSFWGEIALAWMVLAKSMQALLPVVVIAAWLSARGKFRWGRFVISSGVTMLIAWLFLDQIVFVMTSHHSLEYLTLGVNPDAWQWAGELQTLVIRAFVSTGILALFIWGLFEALAAVDRAFDRQRSQRFAALISFGGFVATILSIVGWTLPRVAIRDSDARILALLERNLAWRPVFSRGVEVTTSSITPDLNQRATQAYSRAMTQLHHQPLDDEFRIAASERRHVVLLILESFRRDLLDSDAMPACMTLANEGVFLERHYSNSNMSHYGLFALLYGRSPFLYDKLLDQRLEPQACRTFRNSGYRCSFITSGDCSHWLRMGEFLNRQTFHDVVLYNQKSWVDRDRRALTRVAEQLQADPREQPQFVVCFLNSTHFPYEFPAKFQRFQPIATAKDVLAMQQPGTNGDSHAMRNRQRNAASFLDSEIQRFTNSLNRSKTLLVVTGDHAESFGDDGCYFHGSRLSDAQTAVPALFWGAGVSRQVVRRMTSHVDVLPTLLMLLTGGRGAPIHLHGRCILNDHKQEPDHVLLVHGRLTSRGPFERAVLVSDGIRLPMLLHSARGAGVTVLDPVDAADRILPRDRLANESLVNLPERIEAMFRTIASSPPVVRSPALAAK